MRSSNQEKTMCAQVNKTSTVFADARLTVFTLKFLDLILQHPLELSRAPVTKQDFVWRSWAQKTVCFKCRNTNRGVVSIALKRKADTSKSAVGFVFERQSVVFPSLSCNRFFGEICWEINPDQTHSNKEHDWKDSFSWEHCNFITLTSLLCSIKEARLYPFLTFQSRSSLWSLGCLIGMSQTERKMLLVPCSNLIYKHPVLEWFHMDKTKVVCAQFNLLCIQCCKTLVCPSYAPVFIPL